MLNRVSKTLEICSSDWEELGVRFCVDFELFDGYLANKAGETVRGSQVVINSMLRVFWSAEMHGQLASMRVASDGARLTGSITQMRFEYSCLDQNYQMHIT